ncbi:unnamed protein product [Tilletia caries]|uniref:DNA-directed RNA polymerases I, II, and III subunit RPABC5 n=1 Tax=Tilletia controversa TaxID=13291 RepID=A0A8X7MV02_9BASI|nr:hypothetical protein A4X06_0g3641 [Tilletia controversa]CAD6887409.1 unnamed protein product [Tilletia caries]CAD7059744.1 unnamed protein product [Tilletia caries]
MIIVHSHDHRQHLQVPTKPKFPSEAREAHPRSSEANIPSLTGDKWEVYLKLLLDGLTEGEALTQVGLSRYCCRRMILTHVDLIEKLLQYNIHERKNKET